MAYTDLFNEAIDDLKATLQTVSGLPVVDNPQNAAGFVNGFVLMQAPSFESFNYNIAKLTFELLIVLPAQGNLSTLRRGLQIAASLMALKIAVMSGRPAVADIGGADSPAYALTVVLQAQTA